ncbi:unnamed protein product [Protopolystoma xenopodis]|uniref:Uncharacterized protein n=1 Tax=Protopolystoma xenopodis TaxID=117903 RepID=A0A448WEM6_9PLAT|nr:unnamed protein product [Protopolystoma xenopodis]
MDGWQRVFTRKEGGCFVDCGTERQPNGCGTTGFSRRLLVKSTFEYRVPALSYEMKVSANSLTSSRTPISYDKASSLETYTSRLRFKQALAYELVPFVGRQIARFLFSCHLDDRIHLRIHAHLTMKLKNWLFSVAESIASLDLACFKFGSRRDAITSYKRVDICRRKAWGIA